MIRKMNGQNDNKKNVKKAVDYLIDEELTELSRLIYEFQDEKAIEEREVIRTELAKEFDRKFPNSIDFSNLTHTQSTIVNLMKFYRKKHGMRKVNNREIIDRFIDGDLNSKYFFAEEVSERIRNDQEMGTASNIYFYNKLQEEILKMMEEGWSKGE